MKTATVSAVLLALCLCLTACGRAAAPAPESAQLVGGWSAADAAELSPALRENIDRALAGLTGVSYEPIAHLADQVVAGMNRAVLCRAQTVTPDARPYYAIAVIYEDLQGGAALNGLVSLTPSGELDENAASRMALAGGWFVPEEQDAGLAALAKADGSRSPVWVLGQQVVAGMNYCVLCREGNAYALVYVYEDLSGGAKITEEREFWGEVLRALETAN